MANQNAPLANYEAVRRDFVALVSGVDAGSLETVVPATPAWTVLDVVRHVAHLAECTYRAGQPALVLSQWSPDSEIAAKGALIRDEWTASGVATRAQNDLGQLIAEWDQTWPSGELTPNPMD